MNSVKVNQVKRKMVTLNEVTYRGRLMYVVPDDDTGLFASVDPFCVFDTKTHPDYQSALDRVSTLLTTGDEDAVPC